MPTEFDNFVDALPGNEPGFDINRDLSGDSQPAQAPAEGQAPDPVAPVAPGDEEGPFNKNPKIKRFIQKQVQKGLEEALQSQMQPNQVRVDNTPTNDDVPAAWIAMYGDNEDSRKAWKHNSMILDDYKMQAKQEALAEIRSEQDRATAEVQEFEGLIESSLEDLEEEYNVDLTSNTPAAKKARSEYLDLVQRLSPKDADGNVTSYADFHETWNIYQSSRPVAPTNTRNKDLAARSISQNSDAPAAKPGYVSGMGTEEVRRAIGLE